MCRPPPYSFLEQQGRHLSTELMTRYVAKLTTVGIVQKMGIWQILEIAAKRAHWDPMIKTVRTTTKSSWPIKVIDLSLLTTRSAGKSLLCKRMFQTGARLRFNSQPKLMHQTQLELSGHTLNGFHIFIVSSL